MQRQGIVKLAVTAKGFTLIELMVTLVILGVAATFIYAVFITQHDSYIAQQDVSETQQDVRVGLDMLTRDLRAAGYGVPAGVSLGGGTGITAASATSIQFNTAQGLSTYLTAAPAGAVLTIHPDPNGVRFVANNRVNLISVWDKSQIGSAMYTISSVSGTTQLILSGTAPAAYPGDLVVGVDSTAAALNSITYGLVLDTNNPGPPQTYLLQRISTTNGTENLADHILLNGLQFSYTLADGTTTTTPTAANLPNIRMVDVKITSETVRGKAQVAIDQIGTLGPRQRQLRTFIRVKNST
jgi:prepilin-type N-terminal cleavage/methylation domain-containing protein